MDADNASVSGLGREPANAGEALASASVHVHTLVEPEAALGPGARVWAFTRLRLGPALGWDFNRDDHAYTENAVAVGDRWTARCGMQSRDGAPLADDLFVGPNATPSRMTCFRASSNVCGASRGRSRWG